MRRSLKSVRFVVAGTSFPALDVSGVKAKAEAVARVKVEIAHREHLAKIQAKVKAGQTLTPSDMNWKLVAARARRRKLKGLSFVRAAIPRQARSPAQVQAPDRRSQRVESLAAFSLRSSSAGSSGSALPLTAARS